MIANDIDELLAKSVVADPSFAARECAPSRDEDRQIKQEKRRFRSTHLGGWYNMRKVDPKRDESLQKDLELLQYRNFVVDERAYRRPDKGDLPKFAEIGTVVHDDLIASRNLQKSREGKSLFDEWMKEDKLRSISTKFESKNIIEQGSSALSQRPLPGNLSTVIPSKFPKVKSTKVAKKKKVSKRKL